jgi:hypothetical protein
MFLRILTTSMAAMALAAGAAWAQTSGGTVVGPPASGANVTPGPNEPGGLSQNGTPSYNNWNYNYGRHWQNRNYYQGQYYNPYYSGPTWGIDPYYYGR